MDFLYSIICKIPFVKDFIDVKKGPLSWLVDVIEVIIVIAYLWIGFKGIFNGAMNFDVGAMFSAVKGAIWFLVVAIAANTVLCLLPKFTSKGNRTLVIWNVIWIIYTVYELMTCGF